LYTRRNNIYVNIFLSHRFGYIPGGSSCSIPAFTLNNSSGHDTKKIKNNNPSIFFFFLLQRWYTRVLRLRAKQFSFVYAEIIWYAGLEAVTLWSIKKKKTIYIINDPWVFQTIYIFIYTHVSKMCVSSAHFKWILSNHLPCNKLDTILAVGITTYIVYTYLYFIILRQCVWQ